GTSEPPEDRVVFRFVGDGSRRSFAVEALGSIDVIVDGKPSLIVVQHSVQVVDGQSVVRFVTAPHDGVDIVVGITKRHAHLAGTSVIDGTLTFKPEVPVGPEAGNRDLEPMRSIIAR
ncbi:MAG: hypothetical protein ACLGIM_00270, partial [Alphaproteobacteria bacterium]